MKFTVYATATYHVKRTIVADNEECAVEIMEQGTAMSECLIEDGEGIVVDRVQKEDD